jgi:hypothetical protein
MKLKDLFEKASFKQMFSTEEQQVNTEYEKSKNELLETKKEFYAVSQELDRLYGLSKFLDEKMWDITFDHIRLMMRKQGELFRHCKNLEKAMNNSIHTVREAS